MAPNNFNLTQNLIDIDHDPIPTITIEDSGLVPTETNPNPLSIFDHAFPLGLAPGYSEKGRLVSLAILDGKHARIIEFAQPKFNHQTKTVAESVPQNSIKGRELLQDKILCRQTGDLYAFDMGPLALSLYYDLQLRITNAVDVQSGFSAVARKPIKAILDAFADVEKFIMTENINDVFRNPIYDKKDRNCYIDLAQRAWIARYIAVYGNGAETFQNVPKINTMNMANEQLHMLAKVATDTIRLTQGDPIQKTISVKSTGRGGELTSQKVHLNHRNNKVRGENQKARITVNDFEQNQFSTQGFISATKKTSSDVSTGVPIGERTIVSLTLIGRDDPTTAEALRAATILRVLQGSKELLTNSPWIQNIWFPSLDGLQMWPDSDDWTNEPTRAKPLKPPTAKKGNQARHTLNKSQQCAVNTLLSFQDKHRITLIQGPPGTGKTSVIAAYVQSAIKLLGYRGIWLVAQSNVAVKNIAEKLQSVGFLDFRIIVSKDFYDGWHEHLYTDLMDFVIFSDALITTPSSSFIGCQVVLSTLNMLSNKFVQSKITRYVPLTTLIVDEASQIEIGNYISIFSHYTSLRKVGFIGDDKQLPPHGQEDLQDLQSIFEITHLQRDVIFLETQYRMPPQIGDFISEAVYEDKLRSNPLHPITDKVIACYFIDAVANESKKGTSYMNNVECDAVLKLARYLQDNKKDYRIITPYENQRTLIEETMKMTPDLNWGDKCFNVDAFQGNEEDYIIISLVRSRALGFMADLRRTNVMLTRCKKGMFIVTSKNFLNGIGADSLAGKLKDRMGPEAWLELGDLEKGIF